MLTFQQVMAEVPKGFDDCEAEAEAFFENDTWDNFEAWEFWEKYAEAFAGVWGSEVDFAENLADDLGYISEMPDHLRYYFDYEAFARDLFIGDYFSANTAGGVVVFRTNY